MLNLVRLFHLIAKFSYELKSEFNDGNIRLSGD